MCWKSVGGIETHCGLTLPFSAGKLECRQKLSRGDRLGKLKFPSKAIRPGKYYS